jgi:hypothetical protein
MTRWEALVRYDPEIKEAALRLMPFGSIWVDRLGEAFFALDEDRKYLPNIVAELVREAEHLLARTWIKTFLRTQDGKDTSEEALAVLAKAQAAGCRLTREADGTIAANISGQGTSYLRSSADIVRFATFALKELDPKVR